VFFGSDGVGSGLGHALHDLDVRDVEFITSGGALIGADLAFDDDAGFLGESFDGVENLGRDGVLRDYALDNAGAVAKLGEEELAAFAEIVEPSADGDGLAFVLADFCDGRNRCRHRIEICASVVSAERSEVRGQIAEVKTVPGWFLG